MLRDKISTFIRQHFHKLFVIAFIASIPLSSAVAMAIPSPSDTHKTQIRKSSFYINTGLGIDIFSSPTTDQTSGVIATFPTIGTFGLKHATRMGNSSTTVSIGLGYIHPVNHWFNLGARVFANYANNFDTVAASSGLLRVAIIRSKTEAKLRNFEYGLDLTPSVNIGDNQFLTGIFGLAFNRLRLSNTSEVFGAVSPPITAQAVETSMKRSVRGLRLGYSVEALLNRSVSLYMTYIWTGYGSVHLLETQPSFVYSSSSDINLQTHHILLGLKYYFSPQNYVHRLRRMANAFNRFYAHLSFGTLIPQVQDSEIIEGQAALGANVNKGYSNGNQVAPAPMTVLGLGYGFLMHHFYLGTEALMNLNLASQPGKSEFDTARIGSGSSSQTQSDTNLRLRLNTVEAALDVKLGGLVASETLLIGRVGLSVNHILLQNLRSVYFTANRDAILEQRINKTVVGLRFGAGIEKLFSNNVSLNMNYVYTYYGHVSGGVQSGSAFPLAISDVSTRVATHAVTVGVNYYFG